MSPPYTIHLLAARLVLVKEREKEIEAMVRKEEGNKNKRAHDKSVLVAVGIFAFHRLTDCSNMLRYQSTIMSSVSKPSP